MSASKYWIATISKEHAIRGVSGGFMQVCHGKEAPLKRMKKGDYLLVYSSKITMEGNENDFNFISSKMLQKKEAFWDSIKQINTDEQIS